MKTESEHIMKVTFGVGCKIILATIGISIGVPPTRAQNVSIVVGTHSVMEGDPDAIIPIFVTGSNPVTDMTGLIQISDGGPLLGGSSGPVIMDIDYAGSIWDLAPGGFVSFNASSGPPEQIIDPNVSLLTPGEDVLADGLLCELIVDVRGFVPGDHVLDLSGSIAGSTSLFLRGEALETTVLNGTIHIEPAMAYWRGANFPDGHDDPAKEATVWGDFADPDFDGKLNYVEFKLGTNPNDAASGPEFPSVEEPLEVTGDYLLTFRQRAVDPEGISCIPQGSTDLDDWENGNVVMEIVSVTPLPPYGEFEKVVVRATFPSEASPPETYFMRLMFER